MSDARTSLVGGPRLTPEEARVQSFPVVFRGYDRKSVEDFLARASGELASRDRALAERQTTEGELVREVERLTAEAQRRSQATAPMAPPAPAAAPARNAVSVLDQAQRNADRMTADAQQHASQVVGQAQHQAEQMMRHASQQAGQLIAQAQAEAEQERTRIIGSAAADAQRRVDFLLTLARTMSSELRSDVDRLLLQLGDWESRVQDGAAAPVPA